MLFWSRRLLGWCLILPLSVGWMAAADARKVAHPVLGTGRGLDHVGILVTHLAEAGSVFSKRLGFTLDAGGKLPFGTENATIDFEDETFLELIAIHDRPTALERKPGLVRFLDRGEGGAFVVMDVSSARQAFETLTRRGQHLIAPRHVTMTYPGVAELAPGWTSLFFETPPFAADPLFFIEYDPWREFQARHPEFKPDTRHPNGAIRLRAAWMAVTNAADASDRFRSMGFSTGSARTPAFLESRGYQVAAGAGDLQLVSPSGGRGPVAEFLARHEGGIVGVTIEVKALKATEAWLRANLGAPLRRVAGSRGRSILLEPTLTHGLWIEFVELPVSEGSGR
jgi:catechol 2,3-dioxygenase-like lactoylglutathione lyase family enzyme